MTTYLKLRKWLIVCLFTGLVLVFNNAYVQAKEENPNDKIVKLKDGETPNVAHPDLERKQDEVWEQIVKSGFLDEVDQKLIENGYKRYTHTGEYNINYQIVDLEIDEKSGESRVQTIENIDNIVRQLAKENKIGVPTIVRVTFHPK